MIEKYESRRIREQIRHVLLEVWDPIGLEMWRRLKNRYCGERYAKRRAYAVRCGAGKGVKRVAQS